MSMSIPIRMSILNSKIMSMIMKMMSKKTIPILVSVSNTVLFVLWYFRTFEWYLRENTVILWSTTNEVKTNWGYLENTKTISGKFSDTLVNEGGILSKYIDTLYKYSVCILDKYSDILIQIQWYFG